MTQVFLLLMILFTAVGAAAAIRAKSMQRSLRPVRIPVLRNPKQRRSR